MSSNAPKLSSDSMMILEQSLLKVPVEAMRRTYRAANKAGDKELSSIEKELKRARKASGREDKLRQAEAALSKLHGVRRKLEDASASQSSLIASSKTRIAHLQTLSGLEGFSSRPYATWAHTRLQRHLVDYLLRRGYVKTAELLAKDENLDGLSDVELQLFDELSRIEQALQKGSAADALLWCKDNSATLKKGKSTLEFDLRFQEFIELARQGRKTDAIAYCKKHLIPAANTAAVGAGSNRNGAARVRQAMALLAFGPDTTCPPYKALYDPQRWHALCATFRRSFLSLYNLPPLPLLNLSLWAGLAALKLPSCVTSDDAEHNSDCPTCDQSLLGSLARAPEVPWGHHANSIIVCRITGKVLAGEDTAYALPNGRVYSGEACEAMRDMFGGKVTCPRTGESFEFSRLKRVYIT